MVRSGWNSVKDWIEKKNFGGAVNKNIGLSKTWSSVAAWIQDRMGGVVQKAIGLTKTWGSVASWIQDRMGGAVQKTIGLTKTWHTVADWVSDRIGGSVSIEVTLRKAWNSVRGWAAQFMESGGIITDSGRIAHFASGGMIRNGRPSWWDSITKYASGTARARGTAFVAGESGPEIVGHVNGRTEVLNKSQLAATMHAAVLSAMSEAVNAFASFLSVRLAECANGIISAIYAASDIPIPIPVSLQIDDIDLGRYAGMLSGLSALSNVSYTAPAVASGTVMPYSVTVSEASLDKLAGTIETSNDELGQVVVSAISSAAMAIITALQQAQMRGESPDLSGITQQTIDDINRRTRMFSASPII